MATQMLSMCSLDSVIERSVLKSTTKVTLKYNLYVSVVYYSYNIIVLVLAITTCVVSRL